MKLVEAESTGPVEGEDAIVTPPRPPHRRVSVSLLFTASVLIGVVVAIYVVFPARKNVLAADALDLHRAAQPAWDLVAPSQLELRAWTIGVVGKGAPVPDLPALGARRSEILERHAALIRYKLGSDELTYIVGRAARIAPEHGELPAGELAAVSWVHGPFVCAGVGPVATQKTWLTALGGK